MVCTKFVYARVDRQIKSRELKEALELLETAGIVTRIKRTNGAGLPLEANVKSNFFTVLFLDIGLLHNVSGIKGESIRANDLAAIFNGAVAEQFTGQELLVSQNPYRKPGLFYWAREAKNSSAEIDYLIEHEGDIIPVEVKSGSFGRMKSMKMFMNQFESKTGLKISQSRYAKKDKIISIPFYGIGALFQ